ncbi:MULTISPECIES: MurR/RpiR family transcriptional regulator [Kordiimonas]|jgi:DNA-binding MurR/RpiR family transcriptional regulator|uniref:Transcriptional regulator, RpiR family n=1 Tax=Kordiimonas lacus TaxID=637679 RepID=A0A1G7D4A4_9PROT|nr:MULTISPECIES: MurR/RpiR family transcriptional regulator [Kordiimonas]SDE46357.1 transcriptional regulator, RpiR family [Kordiimonas lacus]
MGKNEGRATYSLDEFNLVLAGRFDSLSKQLKKIARFILDNPIDTALDTAAEIATRLEVQPSSLIRFAQALDFEGFSEIQKIFRANLVQQLPGYSANYSDRIRELKEGAAEGKSDAPPILDVFLEANSDALTNLKTEVTAKQLETAINTIKSANNIYLLGQRRSYPVASFLYYMMRNLDLRAFLLDGVGGNLAEQVRLIGEGDVLLVATFPNYADEVIGVAQQARDKGAKIIAMTDKLVSPIVKLSDTYFLTDKVTVSGFRTITGTMCLAQALAIGLGMDGNQLTRD